jgi:hypothetical protein
MPKRLPVAPPLPVPAAMPAHRARQSAPRRRITPAYWDEACRTWRGATG